MCSSRNGKTVTPTGTLSNSLRSGLDMKDDRKCITISFSTSQ